MSKFGATLRRLRKNTWDEGKGGALSQQRLAALISQHLEMEGWPYMQIISNWERGISHPDATRDRDLLVAIVSVLKKHRGLQAAAEADQLLAAGGYCALSVRERSRVFGGEDNACAPAASLDVGRVPARAPGTTPDVVFWQGGVGRVLPLYQEPLLGAEPHLAHLLPILTAGDAPWLIAIEGIGGIGKTALACALMQAAMDTGAFSAYAWVGAHSASSSLARIDNDGDGAMPSAEDLIATLATHLIDGGEAAPGYPALRDRLTQSPHVLLIDGLDRVAHAEQLLVLLRPLLQPTKVILTSRRSLYNQPDVYRFILPELTEADALRLIRREAQLCNLAHVSASRDPDLWPIYQAVGGNPLALHWLVSQMYIHPLDVVLDNLDRGRGDAATRLYSTIYGPIRQDLAQHSAIDLLRAIAAHPDHTDLKTLNHTSGLSQADLHDALEALVRWNLVNIDGDLNRRCYSIHRLTGTFLHASESGSPPGGVQAQFRKR